MNEVTWLFSTDTIPLRSKRIVNKKEDISIYTKFMIYSRDAAAIMKLCNDCGLMLTCGIRLDVNAQSIFGNGENNQ